MRVLITGITGFVGSHMAEYALARGAQVFGSNRWRSKTENIEHLRSTVTFIESDLRDVSSVRALLEISVPDYVVHLAAQSFVGASWRWARARSMGWSSMTSCRSRRPTR